MRRARGILLPICALMLIACGGDPFTLATEAPPDARDAQGDAGGDAPATQADARDDARGAHEGSAPDAPPDAPPEQDVAQDDATSDAPVDTWAPPVDAYVCTPTALPCLDQFGSAQSAPGYVCVSTPNTPTYAFQTPSACAACGSYTCACLQANTPSYCVPQAGAWCSESAGYVHLQCQ